MLDSKFLSTLSLRRATWLFGIAAVVDDISIHALLAESDYTDLNSSYGALISIHALLAESDFRRLWLRVLVFDYFYPRSPCGERHLIGGETARTEIISIHALLAESDGRQ